MDLTMFVNTAWGRCLHCSTRARSRSPNGCGGFSCWRTRWPSLSQICSIGMRSGLCDGQFKNSTSWTTRGERTWAKKQPHTMRLTTANRRSLLVVVQGNLKHKCSLLIILWILFWPYTLTFLTFINTTTYRWEFFHISTNIQMFCGLNAKKSLPYTSILYWKFGSKNSKCQVFIFAQYTLETRFVMW